MLDGDIASSERPSSLVAIAPVRLSNGFISFEYVLDVKDGLTSEISSSSPNSENSSGRLNMPAI
jgi:hypothetical protein